MGHRRDYAIITLTYWAFTLTDGALRMLVLLHLYEQGLSALELAGAFLLYELFGVVTNFMGGRIGARFGLKSTLVGGLLLQVGALGMLAFPSGALTVGYVMAAQALSGVAKDLTKMSSKSYLKLVVPEGDASGLLRWAALLTGSKNSLKGAGFFLGGWLLALIGFRATCAGMLVLILVALAVSAVTLPAAAGKAEKKPTWLSSDARLNWLSAARLFLFGARDVWFVIALPVFLASELGWSHTAVGSFLALWIIGYGIVQASAPAWVQRKSERPGAGRLGMWSAMLAFPLLGLAWHLNEGPASETLVVLGLAFFGVVFAVNSALHSFLVVHYAGRDRIAADVGFYYTANAAGRLVGTVLSGAVFGAYLGSKGLVACLVLSALFACVSAILTVPLRRAEAARRIPRP